MAKYPLLRLRHNEVTAEPVTEVNIIPVIDISLVLLVILFVTAPLLSYPSLPIKLPGAEAPQSSDITLAVTYTQAGQLAVRSADVDWAGLSAAIKGELQRHPESVVLLRVDQAVSYRIVQRLLSAAKAAGAKQIALATEPRK
ncbi:MAG: biopolymer transporter ExbD [Elusimicrobiota bacterium]